MIALTRSGVSLTELAGLLGRTTAAIEELALGRVPEQEGRPSRQELLRSFLSDRERTILRALVARSPARCKDVQDAVRSSRVSRTEFYVLWGSLQIRGLVAERRDGLFELAAPWVAELAR